jgi:hypothetical protein
MKSGWLKRLQPVSLKNILDLQGVFDSFEKNNAREWHERETKEERSFFFFFVCSGELWPEIEPPE